MPTVLYETPGRAAILGQTDSVVLTVASAVAAPNAVHELDAATAGQTLNWNTTAQRDGGGTADVDIDSTGAITLTPDVGNVKPYGSYNITYNINGGANQTYNIRHKAESTVEALFTGLTQDSDGWTVLAPESDSGLFYVDPGGGGTGTRYTLATLPNVNDWENPGAVDAYPDIASAIAAMNANDHDWLLGNRGKVDPVSGQLELKGGTSNTQRATYTSYGTGANFVINQTGTTGDGLLKGRATDNHITIAHIDLTCTFKDPDHVDFVGYQGNTSSGAGIQLYTGDGGAGISNYLIEGCKISHFADNINTNGADGITNLVIRRNHLYRAWTEDTGHAQGAFITNCSMLFEDNVLDHNGWTQAGPLLDTTTTSGSTTTAVVSGAGWTTDEWVGLRIFNNTSTSFNGYGTVTGNTGDTITFSQTKTPYPDFTSASQNVVLGGDAAGASHGQATIFNHNAYFVGCKNSIVRRNLFSRSSSIGMKLTSNPKWTAGSHTGGTETTTLIDSDRGVGTHPFNSTAVGRTVTNNTSGASGAVTSVTNDTTLEVTLTGGSRQDWQNLDTYDFEAISYATGWSSDEAQESDWLEGSRQRCDDFIEYENVYVQGELGGGFGGNDDYDVGYRWFDMRFCDSFYYAIGDTQPGNRTVAHASSMDDANGCLAAGNIFTKFGNTPVNNAIAYQISGHLKDAAFNRNVIVDIGSATGSNDGAGGLQLKVSESPNFTSLDIIGNYIQMKATDGQVILDHPSSESAALTVSDNKYYTDRTSAEWAEIDGSQTTIAAWIAEVSETGSTTTEITFVDSTRTLETYQTSLSATATIEAFITDAAAFRDNQTTWSNNYDMSYVNQYIRRGYTE